MKKNSFLLCVLFILSLRKYEFPKIEGFYWVSILKIKAFFSAYEKVALAVRQCDFRDLCKRKLKIDVITCMLLAFQTQNLGHIYE